MAEQLKKKRFLYNNYASTTDDPGVPTLWNMEGDDIPIRLKKTLTIHERRKASERATKMHFDQNGMPHIKDFDDAEYSLAIAEMVIKSWPLEDEDGQIVPIDRAHLQTLPSYAIEDIANRYMNNRRQQEEETDGPFESPSDVLS